jgi:hypothetical protein
VASDAPGRLRIQREAEYGRLARPRRAVLDQAGRRDHARAERAKRGDEVAFAARLREGTAGLIIEHASRQDHGTVPEALDRVAGLPRISTLDRACFEQVVAREMGLRGAHRIHVTFEHFEPRDRAAVLWLARS